MHRAPTITQVRIEIGQPSADDGFLSLSPTTLLVIGMVSSVVFIVVMVWLYERFVGRHREARVAAHRAGFRYHGQDAKDIGRTRFAVFGEFDRMSISHQMAGRTERGTAVVAFDFCPQVQLEVTVDEDGNKRRRRLPVNHDAVGHPLVPRIRNTEWVSQGSVRSGAVVDVDAWLPRLIVAPEGQAWKAYSRITGADIDFESEAFNRRYRIVSGDPDFARRFLSATVIDVLLRSDGELGVETFGDRLLVFGRLQPPRELPSVGLLAGMLTEQIPELVRHEHPLPSAVAAAGADDFSAADDRQDHPSGITW
ncbi:MAG: hypothetical protein ACR2QE_19480 [Acidimicrobiales bacterium]